jgi:hypothetical protein
MNQIASTMGMPAQELATRSSSGKRITGGVTAPPSGTKKLELGSRRSVYPEINPRKYGSIWSDNFTGTGK